MREADAMVFAFKRHGDQKYGELPYRFHLEAVVAVLKDFGNFDDVVLSAAWLHDVLEDTPTTYAELYEVFGLQIAMLVELVTDRSGKNRAERHARTYPGIALDPKAITLKLADRIANVRQCVAVGHHSLLGMYRREYPDFKSALQRNYHRALWSELDLILGGRDES